MKCDFSVINKKIEKKITKLIKEDGCIEVKKNILTIEKKIIKKISEKFEVKSSDEKKILEKIQQTITTLCQVSQNTNKNKKCSVCGNH